MHQSLAGQTPASDIQLIADTGRP